MIHPEGEGSFQRGDSQPMAGRLAELIPVAGKRGTMLSFALKPYFLTNIK